MEAGEVGAIWRDGFLRNATCSCGSPFRSCPFWRRVIARAGGGIGRAEALAFARLADRAERAGPLAGATAPQHWLAALGRWYAAIGAVARAPVVVDTSKSAGYARLLARAPGLRLTAVHLVRDSRAVAYSWSRRTILPRLPVGRACAQWNAYNLGWVFTAVGRSLPVRRVRYEDFARAPAATLAGLARRTGPVARAGGPRHVLSGNPERFQRGPLRIVPDEAWRTGLPARDRRLATLSTWPLLAQFGYLGRGR